MYRKILFHIILFFLPVVAFSQGVPTVKLTQLEKALTGTGGSPVKGMIGLTRASDGKQRYATYVNVADVCRPTTPLPTGNTTNLSEFIIKCGTDSVWYIDWEGRSIFLGTQAAGGGTGTADYDWLEIGNGQIPNSIRDSIWTDNYASVNVRLVWPSAQLLVGDSLQAGNVVVLGNRNTRVGFYRLTGPDWSSIGQEGATLTARLGTGTGGFEVAQVGGPSPTQPTIVGARQIFRVNTDSTIQIFDYKNTRNDTGQILNFLYTDSVGILRSSPVGDFPGGGGGGALNVDYVADSTAFRGYSGTAPVVIMADTARGGLFRACTACTADQYMIFQTASGKYERFGYDRILESWWGKWGSTSLQRALDYVWTTGANNDKTQGILWHNQEITLKKRVNIRDGARWHGISPVLIDGTHPNDAPAKNQVFVDMNSDTANVVVFPDNGRGYTDQTGISDIAFNVISPANAIIVSNKPFRGTLNNIMIGPGFASIASRRFNYGIFLTASVITTWRDIYISGAKKAAIADGPAAFSGGTLRFTGMNYLTRSTIGVDFSNGNAFFADGLNVENIDSFAIVGTNFVWNASYTESTPLLAGGAVIKTVGNGTIQVRNVTFNGGAACATGPCDCITGTARYLNMSDNLYFNVNRIVGTPATFNYGILGGGSYQNVATTTQNLEGRDNFSVGGLSAYSGAVTDTMLYYHNGNHRFKRLLDNNSNLPTEGQIPVAQVSGGTFLWNRLNPAYLATTGATNGNLLGFNGTSWGPRSLTLNHVPVGDGNGLSSTTNLQFIAQQLSVNAGGTPQAALHVVSKAPLEKAWIATNSTGARGFEVNRDGNFTAFGSDVNNASITAGLVGGFNLNAGVLNIATGGTEIRYKTSYNGGHSFQYFTGNTSTSGEQKCLEAFFNFSPTSGNARGWAFKVGGAINQTGLANGETGGILIPLSFAQSTPNFKGIKIEPVFGYGIHQSANAQINPGASVRNALMANTGIGDSLPDTRLCVHNGQNRTFPILKLQNLNDTVRWYGTNTDPNGVIAARVGSLAFGQNGFTYQKLTGTGNTGWARFWNSSDEAFGDVYGPLQSLQITAGSIQPADHANISGSGTEGFQPYWTGTTWIYSDKRQSAYTVVTTNGTVDASSNRRNTVFNPGSTQSTMTVRLHPAGTPVEGQEVALTFVNEIVALTISSNGAAAVLGAPNTVAAGRTLTFKFYQSIGANGTWILQQ